ncbi:hypothetical protein [Chryseobacterium cheonjiense]|uniref:Lipoprotein n=1 Tax=Chryseobacterium cheonjiense TaxID=2728845 RepID=A0A7Y0A4V6_9FLAO|nr:hypothetical protein [Chryseobacterium cheonjiense]NML56729.1 hypothetical protein [Chryseobacterium cheonjiense]
MNNIYKVYFVICFLFLTSCSNTHLLYENKDLSDKIEGISKVLYDKYELHKDEKSLIVFESNFNNMVKIINDNKIIFNRNIETKPTLGFAAPCIINNFSDVSIFIDGKKKITLKPENINNYKFIYINKHGNRYSILFTNKAHSYR